VSSTHVKPEVGSIYRQHSPTAPRHKRCCADKVIGRGFLKHPPTHGFIRDGQPGGHRAIPFRHGQRLLQACTAPAEFCVLKGMGHNDPLPADFYVALQRFLSKTPPRE
jgi:hypothetical protein